MIQERVGPANDWFRSSPNSASVLRLLRPFTRCIKSLTQLQRAQRWWDKVGSSMSMLTMREREVLNLVAQGLANKDIATTLGIGLTSVETHLSHLLQKLNLKSRQEMTAFVWRHRLTDCLQRSPLKS